MTKTEKNEMAKELDKIACKTRLWAIDMSKKLERENEYSQLYYSRLASKLEDYFKDLTEKTIDFFS